VFAVPMPAPAWLLLGASKLSLGGHDLVGNGPTSCGVLWRETATRGDLAAWGIPDCRLGCEVRVANQTQAKLYRVLLSRLSRNTTMTLRSIPGIDKGFKWGFERVYR